MEIWEERHRRVLVLLWLHVPALALYGVAQGQPPALTFGSAGLVALCGALALPRRVPRVARALLAVTGLLIVSAALVELGRGLTELHLHVFVVLGIIGFYQDWRPYLPVAGYVVVLYGVLGAQLPLGSARFVLAGFVTAAALASGLSWRLGEQQAVELGRRLSRVEDMNRTDPLTGLPNRRVWDEDLRRELAQARRTNSPLCVALLEIDYLAQYRDARGAAATERLLAAAGEAWRARLRGTDLITSAGDGHFAVLLPVCPLDAARAITERLHDAMPYDQTCSVGLAQWDGSESPEALIVRAAQALHEARSEGRARSAVSPGAGVMEEEMALGLEPPGRNLWDFISNADRANRG